MKFLAKARSTVKKNIIKRKRNEVLVPGETRIGKWQWRRQMKIVKWLERWRWWKITTEADTMECGYNTLLDGKYFHRVDFFSYFCSTTCPFIIIIIDFSWYDAKERRSRTDRNDANRFSTWLDCLFFSKNKLKTWALTSITYIMRNELMSMRNGPMWSQSCGWWIRI